MPEYPGPTRGPAFGGIGLPQAGTRRAPERLMEHAFSTAPANDVHSPRLAFGYSVSRLEAESQGAAGLTALVVALFGGFTMAWHGTTAAVGGVSSELRALASSCDAGSAGACNDLGVRYLRGDAVPRDPAQALRDFERACRGGSSEGCSNLGALHEQGAGTRLDLAAAARLYERACEAGAALGCSNLGALYAKGKGVDRDEHDARRLFTRACETGSALGCSNLLQLEVR